jgi:hypothetical protein
MRISTSLLALLIPLSACQNVQVKNTWRVYNMRFYYDFADPPNIRTTYFSVLRTYFQPCIHKRSVQRLDGDESQYLPLELRQVPGRESSGGLGTTAPKQNLNCGGWKDVEIQLACGFGCPDQNGWTSCDRFSPAPEGESELTEDQKARLKWKLVDIKTKEGYPFSSITWQIVNAVKPNRW